MKIIYQIATIRNDNIIAKCILYIYKKCESAKIYDKNAIPKRFLIIEIQPIIKHNFNNKTIKTAKKYFFPGYFMSF